MMRPKNNVKSGWGTVIDLHRSEARQMSGRQEVGVTHHSNRLFLPLGAGSSGVTGVRVYVTVFVMTCLTLTGLCVLDLGAS